MVNALKGTAEEVESPVRLNRGLPSTGARA